jgi:plasmid maintenance system antidote protein VapI
VISYDLPEAKDAAKLRDEIAAQTKAMRQSAARSRALAKRLKARGLSGADTAVVLGVSPQRVSQLLKASSR